MSLTPRILIAVLVLIIASTSASAQDAISAAKNLYASAAYDEALTALRSAKERGGLDIARQADEYMAFCLLALGRQAEAESAAESAIRINPLAALDPTEASPRIEAMFTQVRKRLLPGLIRDGYRGARESMNQGATSVGMEQLTRVRLMLDAAKDLGAWDETLADVSVLVDGFLDLNRAAAAPRTPPPAAPPPSAVVEAAPRPAPTVSKPPASAPAAANAIFSAASTDVTPPVVIRQEIPEVRLDSPTRMSKRSGILEVTIDERGNVQDAHMRESISPAIDAQLEKAARSWKYQPATKAGTPVRYIKIIGISLGS